MSTATKSGGGLLGALLLFAFRKPIHFLVIVMLASGASWYIYDSAALEEGERFADIDITWTPFEGPENEPHLPTRVEVSVTFTPPVEGGHVLEPEAHSPFHERRIVRVGTRIVIGADTLDRRVRGFHCSVRIHWAKGSYVLPLVTSGNFPNTAGRWVGTVTF
jgi:hypothetical protein